jgi:hypothetical protein
MKTIDSDYLETYFEVVVAMTSSKNETAYSKIRESGGIGRTWEEAENITDHIVKNLPQEEYDWFEFIDQTVHEKMSAYE